MQKPKHPGTVLKDYMAFNKLNATETAHRSQLSIATISQLTKHRRNITASVALKLGALFGTGPHYWMRLQAEHDLACELEVVGATLISQILPVNLPESS